MRLEVRHLVMQSGYDLGISHLNEAEAEEEVETENEEGRQSGI